MRLANFSSANPHLARELIGLQDRNQRIDVVCIEYGKIRKRGPRIQCCHLPHLIDRELLLTPLPLVLEL